jgi:(S)-3,5-dihydroxyphenylglycine transaminase
VPDEPVDLDVSQLHRAVDDPALNSMNFLNEVAQHYPDAVSLAAGRPYREFFDVAALHRTPRHVPPAPERRPRPRRGAG